MIQRDLTNHLKENSYAFDSLDDFSYEFVDVSEDDLNKLKNSFDSKVPYQKVDTAFTLTSIDMDISGYYSVVYAYYKDEWKIMFGYPKDEGEWEYVAKSQTSSKQIMSDLKTVNFEGFKKGYVGTESNTSIKITDRDTKLKINKDDVFVDVTVKTDFAEYVIGVEMIYYFNSGKWILSDAIVEEPKYWKLNYNSDRIPSAPTEASVLEQVTKANNFLTYVANTDYMESYELREIPQLAGVTSITFQYEFETVYKDIGKVIYLIKIPYEWADGEWVVGDTEVTVSDIKIDRMLGVWSNEDGDYYEFTSLEKKTDDKSDKSPYILVGTFYKKTGEDMYAKYTVKYAVNVPLRDNNWECISDLWEAVDQNSIEFKISALSINVKDKQLVSDKYVFIKTADLETGEPVEETTEETSEVTGENTEETSSEEASSEVTETEGSTEGTPETTEEVTPPPTEEVPPAVEG